MTNREKWDSFTEGLQSPQNYLDWAYRFVICAALQRRVWMPPEHTPVYPNIYVPLVGRPGIGKGRAIKAAKEILTALKLDELKTENHPDFNPQEKEAAEAIAAADLESAMKAGSALVNEKPLAIPCEADAVTYEGLVASMAENYRRIRYPFFDEKLGRHVMKVYGHSSMCFMLEEMASLFKKNTENVVNFLLQAYDCGDYLKKTKHSGNDRILRMCVGILAGTTPDFMQSVFDDNILDQGFASRAFFIFAAKNRKTVFFTTGLTPEQKQHRQDLIDHIRKLTQLYGQCQLEPGTAAWLEQWLKDFEKDRSKRASPSPKLDAYYARINIHIMKVAMSLHFSESTDLLVPKARFEDAIQVLREEEKTMHLALSFSGSNPLARTGDKIIGMLQEREEGMTFKELLAECWGAVDKPQLEETLEFLLMSDKLITKQKEDPIQAKNVIYYQLKN